VLRPDPGHKPQADQPQADNHSASVS
jgi:hypothetical protein